MKTLVSVQAVLGFFAGVLLTALDRAPPTDPPRGCNPAPYLLVGSTHALEGGSGDGTDRAWSCP